jgi:phage terminase small subunit
MVYKSPSKKPPKQQAEGILTAKRRRLVEQMVYECQTRDEAAKAAGLSREGARVALKMANVREYIRECEKDVRERASWRAHRQIESLATGAASEHVQLQGSIWLAEDGGYGRAAQPQEHHHTVGGAVGLQVIVKDPQHAMREARAKHGQIADDAVDVTDQVVELTPHPADQGQDRED